LISFSRAALFGRANPSPEHVGVSRFAPPFLCRMALFGFLSAGQRNVALKVHSVVEDAYDFDRAVWCYPVHHEVASTATLPRNLERPKTRYDLVSGLGARDIGTVGKFANRLNDGVAIDTRLSRAKILSGPFEDIRKVEFCGGTEPDVPFPLDHKGPYSAVLEMTFSENSFK
jgi:hypothetical protein